MKGEPAYAPRGLRREEAARYVGVGSTKFDNLVKDGVLPQPKTIGGCRVWDRLELDDYFASLSDGAVNPWDGRRGADGPH